MQSHGEQLLSLDGEDTNGAPPKLLTAEEAAVLLRVARKWVYAHARELGGYRLLGDRGPWRFDRRELLARRPSASQRPSPRRARRAGRRRECCTHTPNGVPILLAEPRREAR